MALIRLPIAGPLETRDGTLIQDEVRTNVYIEPLDNQTAVVKRPGTRLCAIVAPGTCGRGAIFWNGRIRAMFGADVYSQNDCHVGATVSSGGNVLQAGPASMSGSATVIPAGGACPETQSYFTGSGDIVDSLAYNPAASEVWVQRQEEFDLFQARLTRIAATSGAVNGTIILGNSDVYGTFNPPLAYDAGGTAVWARRTGTICKFNATTGALIFETTYTPSGSYNLFVTPNGYEVLLPNSPFELKRINKTTGAVSQTYSGLAANVIDVTDVPGGLVWFVAGTVLGAGTNQPHIYTLDLASGTVTSRYTHTTHFLALAYDSTRGHVWAVDSAGNAMRFNLSYSLQQTFALPFVPTIGTSRNRAVAYDSRRDVLWIADYSNRRLAAVQCATGATREDYTSGIITGRPQEIQVAPDICFVYTIMNPLPSGGYQTVAALSVP